MEGRAIEQQLLEYLLQILQFQRSILLLLHTLITVVYQVQVYEMYIYMNFSYEVKKPKLLVNSIFLFTRGAQYVYR